MATRRLCSSPMRRAACAPSSPSIVSEADAVAVASCFYPYASGAAALTDVLRPSRAMTYKMAFCYVPVGRQVRHSRRPEDREEPGVAAGLWQDRRRLDFAKHLCTRRHECPRYGRIREQTEFVTGPPGTGNTAIPTARGVFEGIRAAVHFKYARNDLKGMRVAVQGVGGGNACAPTCATPGPSWWSPTSTKRP